MKSSDNFKKVIHNYLSNRAAADPLFQKTFSKENKNIDDCITYIINTVHDTGRNGFTDDEIFSMAVHYYDEDSIDVGNPKECTIVTNQVAELTPEEIEEAREEAKQQVFNEEYERLKNKNKPAPAPAPKTSKRKKETHQLELKL